jgi:tRNA(Ile)-lysidine synthase
MADLLDGLAAFITEQRLQAAHCVLAYSGGMDSQVLLHALCQMRSRFSSFQLRAVYVHHGLAAQAAAWGEHCFQQCKVLDVPFQSLTVDLDLKKGESLEARAREVRYSALIHNTQKNETLFVAQHQDDQAETFLLQLCRGAGIKGLASMPAMRAVSGVVLARPFLGVTQRAIADYAQANHLSWCDDPSNQEKQLRRNFLRLDVMPLLKTAWPSLNKTLARSAALVGEANTLLDELAEQDYQQARVSEKTQLNISALRALSPLRLKNLLRYFFQQLQVVLPSRAVLDQIIRTIVFSRVDANPAVNWSGVCVRRYQGNLFVFNQSLAISPSWQKTWDLTAPLILPAGIGELTGEEGLGEGLRSDISCVSVRFRRGGERCRLPGRAGHHHLKKLWQDWRVPVWLRDRIPLIFVGDTLAMVPGFSISEGFQCEQGSQGINIKWRQSELCPTFKST